MNVPKDFKQVSSSKLSKSSTPEVGPLKSVPFTVLIGGIWSCVCTWVDQ